MRTKDGVRKWRWQFSVRRLREAYCAARSSIDQELAQIDEEFTEMQKSPQPDPDDYDEVDSRRAWEDTLIDRHHDAQSALAAIKQGFVVILYHSWEKHSAEWAAWKNKYRHHHVTARLQKAGYSINEGVHKLNKVANCIKHNSSELWKQKAYRSMFEPSAAQILELEGKPDYASHLILTDEDMDAFFVDLESSGPPGPATIGF